MNKISKPLAASRLALPIIIQKSPWDFPAVANECRQCYFTNVEIELLPCFFSHFHIITLWKGNCSMNMYSWKVYQVSRFECGILLRIRTNVSFSSLLNLLSRAYSVSFKDQLSNYPTDQCTFTSTLISFHYSSQEMDPLHSQWLRDLTFPFYKDLLGDFWYKMYRYPWIVTCNHVWFQAIISYFVLLVMVYEDTYSPPSRLASIVLNGIGNTLNSGSLDVTGKALVDFIV